MSNRGYLLSGNFARPTVRFLLQILRTIKYRFGETSYSQEGEDRVLASLLFKLHGAHHKPVGFYVDIGAHHPHRFSNTFLFYKRGWRGINVDAMPGSMKAFRVFRPRDINLEMGVASVESVLQFHIFNEKALNTFDAELAKARSIAPWRVERVQNVTVAPLSKILTEHVPRGEIIDFFTIDVEGFDLAVLQSNDWITFRPLVVLVEIFGKGIEDLTRDPVFEFMKGEGYVLYSKTVNTAFFVDSNRLV